MDRIVECVPNFSEGRNKNIIDAISDSIARSDSITLLNIDSSRDYNRTVATFVGPPEKIVDAAFNATKTASERIDMQLHSGEHPRIGATDVVPFVPLSGVTMEECIELSREYARRVGTELGIPVYLYEEAAEEPERRRLETIRKGQYEGLASKMKQPDGKPDYGPHLFNERSGATVTGARFFLIAYNVNLSTLDKSLAHEIAIRVRESGRSRKKSAEYLRNNETNRLTHVKAMGVLLAEHDITQVSMNLTRYTVTGMHHAFEAVKNEADSLGTAVSGSEIVGLVPLEAMLTAGKYYLSKTRQGRDSDEEAIIRMAIGNLGLNQLYPFDPEEKIIEYRLFRDSRKV